MLKLLFLFKFYIYLFINIYKKVHEIQTLIKRPKNVPNYHAYYITKLKMTWCQMCALHSNLGLIIRLKS